VLCNVRSHDIWDVTRQQFISWISDHTENYSFAGQFIRLLCRCFDYWGISSYKLFSYQNHL